jgi:hypothetical protein
MSFDSALSGLREHVQMLEAARETFPLLRDLQHALRTLRAHLPPPDAHRREEARALLDRLRAALARAVLGEPWARADQERDALERLLGRTEHGRSPKRPGRS